MIGQLLNKNKSIHKITSFMSYPRIFSRLTAVVPTKNEKKSGHGINEKKSQQKRIKTFILNKCNRHFLVAFLRVGIYVGTTDTI